jgi:hypothetical protein
MLSILKTTPSSILVQFGEKTVKIYGESFERGYGSPDFIIDLNSIKAWEKPDANILITDEQRKSIVKYLLNELTLRKWIVTAE